MGFHGKTHTKAYKKRMSKLHSGKNNPMHGMTGDKDPAWKGGKDGFFSKQAHLVYRKKYSRPICEGCGIAEKKTRYGNYQMSNLAIHHVDRNRSNNKKGNLRALCFSCHVKAHNKLRKRGGDGKWLS